jgi:hypothetical protein
VPTLELAVQSTGPVLPVVPPKGQVFVVPRPQFRCLIRLPQFLMPQDAIIDCGAPLTCIPKALWDRFLEGRDFEWLPFIYGTQPPTGRIGRWVFGFQMARFRVPLALMDYRTQIDRFEVIAQFADSDPPSDPRKKAPPPVIIGLWGGLLEGGTLSIARSPTGQVTGELTFP